MGDATVTVRLEDSSGNLISGKVLTSQVRSDLFTRLRMTTGAVFMFGAALAVISPIPFAARLFGLWVSSQGKLVRITWSMTTRVLTT